MPVNTAGQPVSVGGGTPVPQVTGANQNATLQTPGAMSGTLNATFPQATTKTIPAPIVVTSDAANDHINQMNTSVNQSTADTAAHTAAVNTPITPTAPTDTGGKTDTPTGPDYDKEINDILTSLTNGSTTAQPSPLQQNVLDTDNAQVAQDQQTQSDVAGAINSMDAGTYPLSSNEKAQVAGVASSYADALTQAQKYVANVAAGATVAGAQSGMQQYSPNINIGNIQNAVSVAGQKVADINSKILDAQGKLTTALQNQDYKAATDLYKQIGDNITARNKEITDVQKAITDETTQMRDNAKTMLTTLISEQKMDATAAQNTVDNSYKSGMLSVAEKKLADAEIGKSTYNGATSPVTSPLGIDYNPPASIAPYVGFATNGVKYVDMSTFAGTPTEKNAAIADAQAAGYKIITNKNTALDMQNISNATSNLQLMKDAFDKDAPDSATARNTYAAALEGLNKYLQTGDEAALGTYGDTALDILKAISGVQGFRGGTAAIANVKETLPQIGDTQTIVDKKIANIQGLIDSRETALVGKPSLADQNLIDNANAKTSVNTYIQNNPDQAETVAKLYEVQNPDGSPVTDADVYAYLKQAGKLSDTGQAVSKTLSNADMRTLYANTSSKSYNQGNGSFTVNSKVYSKNPDGTFSTQ